jgi:membrane-associated phospholipid phosphatase
MTNGNNNINTRKYLTVSIILLVSFMIVAAIVSPKINNPNGSTSLPSIIQSDDASTFNQLNNSHYKPLDELMVLLSKYGREVVWTIAGILIFFFGGSTGRRAAIIMALAMLVLIPLGTITKQVVGRLRPVIPQADFLMAADADYSYPSGHAVIVSAGAAVLLALFRDTRRKLAVSIGLTVEAALVCVSRVYVGGHYPLDVIGGILLGAGVAFIFVAAASTKRAENLLQPVEKALKR